MAASPSSRRRLNPGGTRRSVLSKLLTSGGVVVGDAVVVLFAAVYGDEHTGQRYGADRRYERLVRVFAHGGEHRVREPGQGQQHERRERQLPAREMKPE